MIAAALNRSAALKWLDMPRIVSQHINESSECVRRHLPAYRPSMPLAARAMIAAAAHILGTSVDVEARHIRALREADSFPRQRRGMAVQEVVPPRAVANYLLHRLVSDLPARAPTALRAWGGLPCLAPDLAGPGRLTDAPPEWTATAALGIGHTALDLIEALVTDAAAGRMEFGRALLSYVEMVAHGPLPMVTIGLTDDGAAAIRESTPLGRLLAEMPICGTYRTPYRHTDDLWQALQDATIAHRGETPALLTTRRSLPLEAIAALFDFAAEDA